MPGVLPTNRDRYRQASVARRLAALFELLGDVEERRAPLPASLAGPARRTLREAARILGPGLEPPPGSRSPGDIFVATLACLLALQNLRRLEERRLRRRDRAQLMPARSMRR